MDVFPMLQTEAVRGNGLQLSTKAYMLFRFSKIESVESLNLKVSIQLS